MCHNEIFIDSNIFLNLLLDEKKADKAQSILELVEYNLVQGFITPLVLEEVCFKLIYAKASEVLNTKNIRTIKDSLNRDPVIRRECMHTLYRFYEYIEFLLSRGLRIEPITYSDWKNSLEFIERYGTTTC